MWKVCVSHSWALENLCIKHEGDLIPDTLFLCSRCLASASLANILKDLKARVSNLLEPAGTFGILMQSNEHNHRMAAEPATKYQGVGSCVSNSLTFQANLGLTGCCYIFLHKCIAIQCRSLLCGDWLLPKQHFFSANPKPFWSKVSSDPTHFLKTPGTHYDAQDPFFKELPVYAQPLDFPSTF